jgi:hypothetical protein
MIKFVSDLRQVGGFLRVLRFPPPIKINRNDIAEMLLSTIAIAKLILSWPPLLENSLIDLISSQKLLKFESQGHNLELVKQEARLSLYC